jgi:hypothetical protein
LFLTDIIRSVFEVAAGVVSINTALTTTRNVGIGTEAPTSLYTLNVNSNINGSNIYEGGVLLSSKFLS